MRTLSGFPSPPDRVLLLKTALTSADIVWLLQTGEVAILALVDTRYLKCQLCYFQWIDRLFTRSYHGHYVVLDGWNADTGSISYKDPGIWTRRCTMLPQDFDRARLSHGTDQDLIVVSRR